MNILNRCISISNVSNSIFNNGNIVTRNYALKSNLPIKWVRPEPLLCTSKEKSGDLGLDVGVKDDDFAIRYDVSDEISDADDIVKRMFKLKFLPRKETVNAKREKIIDLVKRHNLDRGSAEAKIAAMTCEILQLQEHMEKHPRNKVSKVFLIHIIDKRAKLLKRLRTWDYKRFEWILEKLNLTYKPPPTSEERIGPYRKPAIRKLIQEHCDKIIENKIMAYKEELKKQQVIFFKEKAEKLAYIRSQELKHGLRPSIMEEDIDDTRKKVEELSLASSSNLKEQTV